MHSAVKLPIYLTFLLSLFLSFAGCSSDREKLENICKDVQAASQMTDDCNKLASFLAPRTQEYLEIVSKLATTEQDESKRREYIDTVSKCLRGYLEIATGACGSHQAVQDALPRDVKKPTL